MAFPHENPSMLALPLGEWVVVCLLAGALAALLLNIPMYVQPLGYRPAYVAAGGLTRTDPSDASDALAVAVHHLAGVAGGLLYGVTVLVLSPLPGPLLNGVPAVGHFLAVVGVSLFIYFFFERVALPRAGGSLRTDALDITRQWALSAFIYGVTLGLLVPVLVTQL